MQIINVNKETHKIFTVNYSIYFTDVCYPDTLGSFDIVIDMTSSENMDDIEEQCLKFLEESYPRAIQTEIDSINENLIIEKENLKRSAKYLDCDVWDIYTGFINYKN